MAKNGQQYIEQGGVGLHREGASAHSHDWLPFRLLGTVGLHGKSLGSASTVTMSVCVCVYARHIFHFRHRTLPFEN